MIRQLLDFSLRHKKLVLSLLLLLAGLGVLAYSQLKIEAYPDVGDTQVNLITKYDGRAAEEVEKQVTIPLERALNAVPNVVSRRSKTIFGLSVLELTFADGVSDADARRQVSEMMGDADLPDGVSPSMQPIWTPVAEIYRYALEGDYRISPMELRTLQDFVVVPRILQVPGVVDLTNFGGPMKQFQVEIDQGKLRRYNLSAQNLIDAIDANNSSTGGGILRRGSMGLAVRGVGLLHGRSDLENIVLLQNNGSAILLKDVARVEEAPPNPSGIMGYTVAKEHVEVPSGIEGLVVMRRGENPSEVLHRIKDKLKEIQDNCLPAGAHFRTILDREELVNRTLETVSHTMVEGMLIVIAVLFFFLGNVRSAILVSLTIPLSLLMAFILMKLSGIPANLLSLGAIDFGIIVDASVIMAECILHGFKINRQHSYIQNSTQSTLHSTQSIGREIFFSVIIIILGYLPIFTLQRVEGKLFSPMGWTLAFAVFSSMLLAFTLIPVGMSILFKKDFAADKKLEMRNPFFVIIQKIYRGILGFILRVPFIPIGIALALLTFACFGATKVGVEFLPELDEGGLNIRTFLPVGISIQEADRYTGIIRHVIASHPEIRSVFSKLGRNDEGSDPYSPNRIETEVNLEDYKQWPDSLTKPELISHLQGELEKSVPGAVFSFSQPIMDNLTEAVTGSVADLAVEVSGSNLDTLRIIANKILPIVAKVRGASEFGIEQEGNQSQVVIEVNRPAALRYGVNIADVQKMIQIAMGGAEAGQIWDEERKFPIIVRYSLKDRNSLEALRNMNLTTNSGAQIPLSQVANIDIKDGATLIQRSDGERQISVRTNIRGRDQGGFVAEAQKLVDDQVKLPRGYKVEWGGQFENLERAQKRILLVVPITIVIIFGFLVVLYRNMKDALLTLANVPFAVIGGISALYLRGYHFNVSSGVGFISLFGVAIMSGVLLISKFRYYRDDVKLPIVDAMRQSCESQLRPIITMMSVALLGLIPACMANGVGSDVQRPLATVIVGGLLSSLILTLLVLPALSVVIEKWMSPIPKENLQDE